MPYDIISLHATMFSFLSLMSTKIKSVFPYHPNMKSYLTNDNYMLKVNSGKTRAKCEICSYDARHVAPVSLLLTLNIFHTLLYVSGT